MSHRPSPKLGSFPVTLDWPGESPTTYAKIRRVSLKSELSSPGARPSPSGFFQPLAGRRSDPQN
jgi:hypothetical protein